MFNALYIFSFVVVFVAVAVAVQRLTLTYLMKNQIERSKAFCAGLLIRNTEIHSV